MASVTVYSVDKIDEILNNTVVGASITDDILSLDKQDGSSIEVGPVLTSLPMATTAVAGIAELATDTETIEGVEDTKVVTPLSLSPVLTRVGLLEDAGLKELTGKVESDLGSTYPYGLSIMSLGVGSSWSINGGLGTVVTAKVSNDRIEQTFYSNDGGSTGIQKTWVRSSNSTSGWTNWQQLLYRPTLPAASFTESSTLGNYPLGESRIYFTTATSTGWSFAGKAGELTTYREGSDFARQQWVKHVGGTTAGVETEIWIRTATAAGSWTRWRIVANDDADTGWISRSVSGTGMTMQQTLACRRKNGIVYLKGAVTAPSGGYNTFMQLPTGYLPPEQKYFPSSTNTSFHSNLTVLTSGAVQVWVSGSTGGWISISGISYPVD